MFFRHAELGTSRSLWVADADGSNLVKVAEIPMGDFRQYLWMPR